MNSFPGNDADALKVKAINTLYNVPIFRFHTFMTSVHITLVAVGGALIPVHTRGLHRAAPQPAAAARPAATAIPSGPHRSLHRPAGR